MMANRAPAQQPADSHRRTLAGVVSACPDSPANFSMRPNSSFTWVRSGASGAIFIYAVNSAAAPE